MSSTLQTASNDPEEQMQVASSSTPHPRVSPEEFAYDNHSCTESFHPLSQLHPEISDVEHAHSNQSSVDLSALPRPVVVPEEHARDNHPKAVTEEDCRDNHPKAATEEHCRDNHPKAVTEEDCRDNHPKAVTEEYCRDNHPKAVTEEHCRDNHPKAVTEEDCRDNHPKAVTEEYCRDNHPKAVTEEYCRDNHPKAASEEHCRDNHPKATTEEHCHDNHPKAVTEEHAHDNHTCVDSSVLYHPKAVTEEHCRDNHTCVDFSVFYHPKTTSEEHSCDHHSCVEQFSAVSHHPPLSPKEHDCGSNSSVDPSGSVQHHPEASLEQHDSGNRCSSCVQHHPGFCSEKNACGSHSHADYCHSVCNGHPRHSPGEVHASENHSVVHVSHLPQQNARNISVTPSVETGLPKQQATRARRICVLVSVLLVMLGATISLWVILAGRESWRDDVLNNTATIPPPRALDPQMLKDPDFEGSFRMIGTKWISAMSDVNSDAFGTTASKTEQMIDEIYHASNVSDVIAYSVVTSLREGSVIVRFILRLTALPDLPADPAKAALQQRVKRQPSLLVAAFTEGLGRVGGATAPTLPDVIASSVTIRRANTTTISSTTPSSMTTTTASQTTKLTNESRPRCGEVRRQPEARIIGGKTAGLGMYPWVVMIRVDDRFHCGGSIMDRVHVVTAAHCFPDVQWPGTVHNTEVVAGELAAEPDKWTEHAQRVPVSRVYRHEHFNLKTQSQFDSNLNDVAVIRLARPLTFNSYVAPVCIPEVNDTLPSTCLVAGWGSNTSSHTQKTFPDELQVVALWTYNNTACQEAFAASFGGVIYGDYISFYLNDGVMCAANHTSGGQDACFGDSGGPLFCFQPDSSGEGGHYAQFGVVSWGEGCAIPGSPGFYAYLPYFKTWLDDEAVPKLEFLVNISSARCLSERKCADLMTSLKQAAMPNDRWCRTFTEAVDCMLQPPVKDAGCSRDVAVAELWSYLQFLSVPSANSAYNETACTD